MFPLLPHGSWALKALKLAKTAAVASVPKAAGTWVVASVVAVGVLGATPLGRGFLQDLLQNAPIMRGLPGVEAVVGPVPPKFSENLLGFRAPLDVAISPGDEFLYVVEGAEDRDVKRLDLRTGARTQLAPPRTTPGMRKPLSLAVAPNGMVYVVDRVRYVVDVYDAGNTWRGTLSPPAGSPTWEPLAVTVDDTGVILVTNAADEGPSVALYSPDGRIQETYPRLAPRSVPVSFPSAIAVMRLGNGERVTVVSDSNNRRIVALGPGGEPKWTFGDLPGPSALGLPRGVVTIRDDRCLIVDATDHSITAWQLRSDRAEFLYRIAGPGMEDGEFLFPNGITRGKDGRVFVTDRDNDRVQVWR